MTPSKPKGPGDGPAKPKAGPPEPVDVWAGVDLSTVTGYCARGQHHLCHGTVLVYTAEAEASYVPCACPVPNCGHGRRDRVKKIKRR